MFSALRASNEDQTQCAYTFGAFENHVRDDRQREQQMVHRDETATSRNFPVLRLRQPQHEITSENLPTLDHFMRYAEPEHRSHHNSLMDENVVREIVTAAEVHHSSTPAAIRRQIEERAPVFDSASAEQTETMKKASSSASFDSAYGSRTSLHSRTSFK